MSTKRASDETAPRRQRHTAKRVYDRLVSEYEFLGSEVTVRRAVRALKDRRVEVFVPLEAVPGKVAQADFGVAQVLISGHVERVFLFCLRAKYSRVPFAIAFPAEDLVGWERALYAFLVEKQSRSGSVRTVEGYSRMLCDFFGRLQKTPEVVSAQEVFAWAHGKGLSGKEPSLVTVGARLACVSSFFRFLVRMEMVDRNPCDRLERPKALVSPPRGLSADEVRRLLAVVPDTPVGLRNRALILTLALTGRRRAEVFRLTRGDLSFDAGTCFYSYRGKGGKSGRRELPRPALDALTAFGRELEAMSPEESLWPSQGYTDGPGLSSATFYQQLQRYFKKAALPPAGVHVFRHAAAKLRRDAGESIEDVSLFLDHSSLTVTSVYLRRLEGQQDKGWGRVAEAIGV